MSLDHDTSIMVRETVAVSVLRARLVALTFPLAPFLSHAAGEEGGYATTPSPQPPSSPPREAEEEVRVAVAILRLHLATMPRPSDHPSPAARERGRG
jgi:hypothetical protein